MNIVSPFTREFWIRDEDVREAVGLLPVKAAVEQARLSAIALEQDREAMRQDDVRADYLRNSLKAVPRG